MAVILQHQRQSIGVWAVVRPAPVHRPTGDNRIVLHQHAIVEHRHARRVAYRVTRECRPVEDDVVRLPLPGRAAGVDERWRLPVHGGGLAVGVGVVTIRVEHLNLVMRHQEDTAVTALLAFALRRYGRGPFDVQLHVPEVALRADRPGTGGDLHVTVADHPARGRALERPPVREILAVEQHDGVGRRWNGWTFRAGLHDRRAGTVHGVDGPGLGGHRGGEHNSDDNERGTGNAECGTEGGGAVPRSHFRVPRFPHGFHVPCATAGTNFSSPAGGNSSVLPCSALMYAVIRIFTTSTPSSNASRGCSRPRTARSTCRSSASYPEVADSSVTTGMRPILSL